MRSLLITRLNFGFGVRSKSSLFNAGQGNEEPARSFFFGDALCSH
jgi:hypothetical protein